MKANHWDCLCPSLCSPQITLAAPPRRERQCHLFQSALWSREQKKWEALSSIVVHVNCRVREWEKYGFINRLMNFNSQGWGFSVGVWCINRKHTRGDKHIHLMLFSCYVHMFTEFTEKPVWVGVSENEHKRTLFWLIISLNSLKLKCVTFYKTNKDKNALL